MAGSWRLKRIHPFHFEAGLRCHVDLGEVVRVEQRRRRVHDHRPAAQVKLDESVLGVERGVPHPTVPKTKENKKKKTTPNLSAPSSPSSTWRAATLAPPVNNTNNFLVGQIEPSPYNKAIKIKMRSLHTHKQKQKKNAFVRRHRSRRRGLSGWPFCMGRHEHHVPRPQTGRSPGTWSRPDGNIHDVNIRTRNLIFSLSLSLFDGVEMRP